MHANSNNSAHPCLILAIILFTLQITPAMGGTVQKAIDPDNMLFMDFSVSDNDKTIIGLQPGQVKLMVNGVKRDIGYFSRIAADNLRADDPNSWIVANQLRGQHTLVLVLDLNSLDNAALNSTRLSIKSMLNDLPDDNREKLMLVTLGSQISFVQTFTSDKTKIFDALDTIKSTSNRLDYKSLIESISEIFTIQYDQNPGQAMDEAIREANQFQIQIRNRTQAAVAGLEMLTDWFTGLSGPKNVLLFSGGYPRIPTPVVTDILRAYNQSNASRDIMPPSLFSAKMGSGGETLTAERMNSLISKFNRNQLTLSTFDSRDVKSDGLAASQIRWMPSRLVASHNSSHITAGHEFLRGISEPTGGILISNPDNLLDEASGSSRVFYIVGITGEAGEEPGEKNLDIAIEINDPTGLPNPSLKVNRREKFFTLVSGSSDEVLTGAFQFPYYYRDFSVNFDVGINGDQVTVQASIPPDSLRLIKEREDYFCILEVFGLLTDSNGKPLTGDKKYTFAKQFPIRRNETQLQSLLKMKSVSASASAQGIKPGEYTLTVIVRQPRTGLMSASKMNITIN